MRAICEACAAPQPADWSPGDRCIQCGQAVRPEARCFWCVKWTPASGKFCRGCGAAVLESRLFGAARMLKDAGVDRFSVPKMLVELDPEQVENFTNIYQRHFAVLTRHVDHLRFLQTFLQHQDWSHLLEEELIAQLPWPDEKLNQYSPALHPAERHLQTERSRAECRELAVAIAGISPFPLTRTLVALVRLLLEDWSVHRDAHNTVFVSDPLIKGEAAIALTNWRVVYGPGILGERYVLIDALKASPFPKLAAVQLAMLGVEDAQLPPDTIESSDPDSAFSAALASGDVDRLIAAEQDPDPLKRYVAAWKLIQIGDFTGVDHVIRSVEKTYQIDLVNRIAFRKKPAMAMRDVLFELLETTDDRDLRDSVSYALSFSHLPGDTLRLAHAAGGRSRIIQGLLQTPSTGTEELVSLCDFLLEQKAFSAGQWGISDVAKQGRLPANFVPLRWPNATSNDRIEFIKLAEMQLEDYQDEELHRFLVGVVFGQEAHTVQLQAWTSLYRWYGRSDHSGMGPLHIQTASLERFFGSVPAFLPVLSRFLGNGSPQPILTELFVREPLAKLLRYSDPDILPHLERHKRDVTALLAALKAVMASQDIDLMLHLACIEFLVMFAQAPAWEPAVLRLLHEFKGTSLDYASSTAKERVQALRRQ